MSDWRKASLRALLLGLAALALPGVLSAQTTIKGRILYGTVLDDIGEAPTTVPPLSARPGGSSACLALNPASACGFLHQGDPIARVHVQLNDSAGFERAHTITDANGAFSMSVGGSPNLTLVAKAKNDYVQVKKYNGVIDNWMLDDVIEARRAVSINYSMATNDLGDLTMTDDRSDSWFLNNDTTNPKNYVSRAFYVATVGHESGSHLEQVMEGSPVPDNLVVRMGIPSTAFYYTLSGSIFLANVDSATFWHEYGHYIQDNLGGFDLLPAYTADGGHSSCTEMTGSTMQDLCLLLPGLPNQACTWFGENEQSNLTWAWIEGFAQFMGTANSNHRYGGVTGGNNALEGNFASETSICTNSSTWTDPRAVESVVTEVLWDLVDTALDPPNTTGIDEIADADVKDVLEIFAQGVLGLDEFWDAWREREGEGVIVPELYAAYAFNGADRGNAADTLPPERPTLTSSTHEPHQWTNNPDVQVTITDGQDDTPENHDDVSGSYSYYVTIDGTSTTTPSTSGTPTFLSWATVESRTFHLADGMFQHVHVNTADMARHASGASHFGPIHVDTVPPYWTSPPKVEPYTIDPGVVGGDLTLVVEYPTQVTWAAHDDASGVAQVRVTFEDRLSSFEQEIIVTPQENGTYRWLVTGVPPTASALVVFTVTDLAGNELVTEIPVDVVPHFLGPATRTLGSDGAPCDDGRVTSGDVNNDGYDDTVVVCSAGGGGQLFVFRGSGAGLILNQTMPWLAADDVVTADVDRDGDLDVLTVSEPITPGANTQLDVLRNDGTGTMGSPLPSRSLGPLIRKTVRVLTPHNRKAPVAMVFGALASAGNPPAIRTFDFSAGMATLPTPGLDPVDGDWEQGDVNGDGYQDLVAIGQDATGTEAVTLFRGTASGWIRQDVDSCSGCGQPDVDVGDFDSDGRLDLFVMFERPSAALGTTPRTTKLLRNLGGSFTTEVSASTTAYRVAKGDGFIVDTANDARSEVVAMGLDGNGVESGWFLRNDDAVGRTEAAAAPLMTPLGDTDTAWGDFDRDGDLDVFQLGHNTSGFFVVEYENLLGDFIDANDTPRAPRNLAATYDTARGGYVFTWAPPASDTDETPIAGFGYELRVGTSLNGNEVLSWAHPTGASQQGRALSRFVKMAPGTYSYSVRTVDSGWRRSAPAGVKTTTP